MNEKSPGSIWLGTRDSALRSLLRATSTSQGLPPLDVTPEQLRARGVAGIVSAAENLFCELRMPAFVTTVAGST
jgi:hypothetical protein